MKRILLVAAAISACATPALAQQGREPHPAIAVPVGVSGRPSGQLAGQPQPAPAEAPAPPVQHRFDRNRPETWRGRPEWAAFQGGRAGFWYAPGYGYHPNDPSLAGHVWRRGDHLPAAYRAFYVQTPSFYGLRPPPSGDRWVYFEGNFLLASAVDGRVDEVVLGGY